MENNNSVVRWTVIGTALIILAFVVRAHGIPQPSPAPEAARSDIIVIDTMQQFGPLQRPPVVYLHSQHTDALEKQGKDCSTCHLNEPDKKRLSIKYQRLNDTDRETVMNIYHDNCTACHRDMAAANQPSGPVECGTCHRKRVELIDAWQPIGFDLSLHYRHAKAQQKKCETCHHAYNELTKKLYYDKGQEGTCRYCHKAQTEENRISFSLASHTSCVACHRDLLAKKAKTGPIHCVGCHDAKEQALIEKVSPVPRMERNQPNVVFVKTSEAPSAAAGNPTPVLGMGRVPFSHQKHETYNDTCRVCHHAAMSACSQCHTVPGAKEGNYIKLGQAMHQIDSEQSCIGCHTQRQSAKECAGCHHLMEKGVEQSPAFCQSCHLENPGQQPLTPVSAEMDAILAEQLLNARIPTTGTYPEADIPEKVVIKTLVDQYEPSELPHRKIINTLLKNIQNDELAKHFHNDPGTICQGCHHHSPPAKKPPSCASCHGKPFQTQNLFMPGLKAAYHRQCMECHTAMKLPKPAATNCEGCHKERKK